MTKNNPEHWKVLKSEYLSKEPWLTLRKDHVLIPNGHEIPSYYVLEYPNWVNVIALTKDNKLVMIRQYRHGIGEVYYEICGGVCDDTDASPLESAKRELLEETGFGGGEWQNWMITSPNPSTHNNLVYTFLATDVEPVQELDWDSGEDLVVDIMNAEDVKKILMEGKMLQSLMMAPLWKFFAEYKGFL